MPPASPRAHLPVPFIIGSGRSGTTLLRLMLDTHSQLALPPETQFIPALAQACQAADDPAELFCQTLATHPRWPDFHLDAPALRAAVLALQPFTLSAALRCFYRLYAARFDKPRWGDQTPAYAIDAELIVALFPEAHFIHLIRDGRDVAQSYQQVWFGPRGLENAASFWVQRTMAARRAAGLGPYLELRYERLITQPAATLQEICAFLDLPWEAALLDYTEHANRRMDELTRNIHAPDGRQLATAAERQSSQRLVRQPLDPSRAYNWLRGMSPEDVARVEQVAGPLLLELGYPLSAAGSAGLLAGQQALQSQIDQLQAQAASHTAAHAAHLAEHETRLAHLTRDLAAIHHSRAWRAIQLYRRLRARLLSRLHRRPPR